jgi:hypothetical protein
MTDDSEFWSIFCVGPHFNMLIVAQEILISHLLKIFLRKSSTPQNLMFARKLKLFIYIGSKLAFCTKISPKIILSIQLNSCILPTLRLENLKKKWLDRIFYLNLKENGINYKNQFKYSTFYSYLWRYSDLKEAFCAKIHHELNPKLSIKLIFSITLSP